MSSVIADLLAAPEYKNEILAMSDRLEEKDKAGALSFHDIMKMGDEIIETVKAGEVSIRHVNEAVKLLADADPQASTSIPLGF